MSAPIAEIEFDVVPELSGPARTGVALRAPWSRGSERGSYSIGLGPESDAQEFVQTLRGAISAAQR
jgi:hypothetical protein